MMTKRIGVVLLAVLTLLAACAPQNSAVETSRREGSGERIAIPKRITVAVRADGAAVWTTGADSIIELFHAGLVNFDPPGDPTAQLAETLPTIENGLWKLFPDGRMETTLTIREGARWHDGVPVTTADAVFGVALGREFPQGNFGASAFANIERLDARDERTIVVAWKSPYVQANWLFSNLFAPPLPRHLLEESFLADPAGFVNHRYWTTDFVGNGPFMVREFVPGLHLQLRAFEDYVLGRPQIDEIEVRFIPDANTLMANLLAGEIHLTLGAGLSVEQALRVREGWSEGEVIYSPYYATQAVAAPQFLNPDPSILANVQLRRALAHAVDREELVQSIQAGIGAPSSSLPAPTGPEFEAVKSSIVDYAYDSRRASQLLEGLGFTRGPDGMVRDAAGRELPLPVWTGAGDDVYERTTLAVSDYWKRVGLAADPRIVPPTRDASILASRPAMYLTRLRTELDTRFLSAQIPTQENGFRGSNDARYGNPELDALVNRYFVTVSRPERLSTLAEIVRHLTENVVIIHLFHNVVPQMKSQRLQNVVPRTVRARVLDAQRWDLS